MSIRTTFSSAPGVIHALQIFFTSAIRAWSLASSLAILTSVYRNPWSYDLRRHVWPPLLANLSALGEGRAFTL